MIFGNIRQEAAYGFLPEDLKEFFVYAASHELAGYEKGSHPIDGERFFVNIVEYETTLPENRFWEAHRKYLDVHLMLDGQEQIDLRQAAVRQQVCHFRQAAVIRGPGMEGEASE